MKKLSIYLKTFLAAMLLLAGSNYVGAATTVNSTWVSNHAVAPSVGNNYYIYNVGRSKFITIGVLNASAFGGDADVNKAGLFTLTGTALTAVRVQATEPINGHIYYLDNYGTGSTTSTSNINKKISVQSGTQYYIQNAQGASSYKNKYVYMTSGGSFSYGNSSGTDRRWRFVPEQDVHDLVSVTSLKANGTMTIDTPTGSQTANVTFNVSGDGPVSAFTITMTSEDSHFVMGRASRSGNVITVPVTYTAQNIHGSQTATVTITAKNTAATTASGTVTANVDLQPRFALNVTSIDWSHDGLGGGEEVFYKEQEIAASQRDRLSNKLVINSANTSGVATNTNTKWTATITGTNANQFKFSNGTQTVSNKTYSASLLDVIYAPTTTGTHNATLHIVTSYKDANNHTETYEQDIALSGKGSADARIAFAKAGSQLPVPAESHNFGNIIGTNQQVITADLFMTQISNPQMNWDDAGGQWVFVNQSAVNWSLQQQTLSFRAQRTSPVETNTVHTATLTISGKGPANEDVTGTLTLTYTAVPLETPTVDYYQFGW